MLPVGDRLCTLVARNHGEAPIGSANPFSTTLVCEFPLPWAPELTASRGFPEGVAAACKGSGTQLLAVVPDPESSCPGRTRVVMYRSPAQPFAEYDQQEYLVPPEVLVPLAQALARGTSDLGAFAEYRQQASGGRDLMVCTHGSHDQCCGRFGYPLYTRLRAMCAEASGSLRIWRTSHFSGHRFSPTLIDFPEGRFWGNLTEEQDIARLVAHAGPLPDLDRCYRGWAGAPYIVQFAEREMFRRHGWRWTRTPVSARVTDAWTDAGHHRPQAPIWARIDGDLVRRARVEFQVVEDGGVVRTYAATVEFSHMVATLYDCVKRGRREDSPQFRVTEIVAVDP